MSQSSATDHDVNPDTTNNSEILARNKDTKLQNTIPVQNGGDTTRPDETRSRDKEHVSDVLPATDQNMDPTITIGRAFVPHVAVVASPDCEELLRHKGIDGGLLELLRPFGEDIQGRVVIRDSTGASRPLDDFGIRFVALNDGLEAPRLARRSASITNITQDQIVMPEEHLPQRLRTGGDLAQIEQLVERRLDKEGQQARERHDETSSSHTLPSSLYNLYEKKMLSGIVLAPHETFAHPVAVIIATSSRSASPIEDLRALAANITTGGDGLPQWVNNDFLRYHVLVHDEDYDDIKKSTSLFDQMKRHFGLHCHLLRLRSIQHEVTDNILTEETLALPSTSWTSAAEDIRLLTAMEQNEEPIIVRPRIYETDAIAVRSLVREMVTQSIIPNMERLVATWNDQVVSRRKGLSGRFISLSRRFTPFTTRSSSPNAPGSSNFDAAQGIYRADAPEAIMRRLADYAMMLRDYKLAHSVFELLCGDYKSDKAWRYYAGANEMSALTTLLTSPTPAITPKARLALIDTYLENAYYSYLTRCTLPFHAARTIWLGADLLWTREASRSDDAAKWLARITEDRNIGPVGHAILIESIGSCYSARTGFGELKVGARRRKAGFWTTLAAEAWLELGKTARASRCLDRAEEFYVKPSSYREDDQHSPNEIQVETSIGQFEGMKTLHGELKHAIQLAVPTLQDLHELEERQTQLEETIYRQTHQQQDIKKETVVTTEMVDQRSHRRNMSVVSSASVGDVLSAQRMDTLAPVAERRYNSDGFE